MSSAILYRERKVGKGASDAGSSFLLNKSGVFAGVVMCGKVHVGISGQEI